jgi:hypothetical protein
MTNSPDPSSGRGPKSSELPESASSFTRGRYRGAIVALVVFVLAVVAVLALSGVLERKRPRAIDRSSDDNKEGGCPCGCDHSKATDAARRNAGTRALEPSVRRESLAIHDHEIDGEAGQRLEAPSLPGLASVGEKANAVARRRA